MKYFLLLIFVCIPAPVVAAEKRCPAINCDCESIGKVSWQRECRDYEESLRGECIANGGRPQGYCRLHGPDARPLPLRIKFSEAETVEKSDIKPLQKKIKMLTWSANDDIEAAGELEKLKNYKEALLFLKRYEKIQNKIYNIRVQLERSWIALEDPGEAIDIWEDVVDDWKDAVEDKKDAAGHQQPWAELLWKFSLSSEVKLSEKRVVQLLAKRCLNNVGNHYERLADAHARIGIAVEAAKLWQKAAGLSEQMVKWRQRMGGKPAHIRHYRYQAAARWYRAANYWVEAKMEEPANFSNNEAKRIISGIVYN